MTGMYLSQEDIDKLSKRITGLEAENESLRKGVDIWRDVAARNEAEFRTLGEKNHRLEIERNRLHEALETLALKSIDHPEWEKARRFINAKLNYTPVVPTKRVGK